MANISVTSKFANVHGRGTEEEEEEEEVCETIRPHLLGQTTHAIHCLSS